MTLQFVEATPGSQALQDLARVDHVIVQHDLPEYPAETLSMLETNIRHPWPGRDWAAFVAYADGEAVGQARMELPTRENLANLWLDVSVLPEKRRQGFGRQIHDFAVEYGRSRGRTVLQGESLWSLPELAARNEDGARFCEALGYKAANPEAIRRFTIADTDHQKLDAMYDAALAKAAGYRVVTVQGATPPEYAVDVAYLDSRLLSDAPLGDLQLEPEKIDVSQLKEFDDCLDGRGRRRYHAGVVHEATGRMVAWTTIATNPETGWHAWQQITIVDPDHRGHRLGALVKVENLRQFLAAEPNVEVIDTGNAVANSYMIAINEDMGFSPLRGLMAWQLELAD